MFMVSEDDVAAIRAAFDQGGEFSAAIELRHRFPGIADNDQARLCARTIAGWTPTPDLQGFRTKNSVATVCLRRRDVMLDPS